MQKFINLFTQPMQEGVWGWAMLFLVWVGTLLFLALWIYLFFLVFDKWGRPIRKGKGLITSKRFVAAHNTTAFIPVGKIMIPTIRRAPDQYLLAVQIDELSGEYSVGNNPQLYERITVGQEVDLEFSMSRFTKRLTIKSVQMS